MARNPGRIELFKAPAAAGLFAVVVDVERAADSQMQKIGGKAAIVVAVAGHEAQPGRSKVLRRVGVGVNGARRRSADLLVATHSRKGQQLEEHRPHTYGS